MPGILILGAQWGDEAKGKFTDLLASEADVVARYQGGDNAGHTVVIGSETYKFHLIPSGILRPQTLCALGNGMVINPRRLVAEMDELAGRGVDVSPARLKISRQAHILMPYHPVLDGASESALGQQAVGTTRRGIGPAYADKAARQGLRMWDMLRDDFRQRVKTAVERKNLWLERIYDLPVLDAEDIANEFAAYAERLRPYIADVSSLLDEAYRAGKTLLYEGAQGTLLDLDHGTYPYVTSSWTGVGGALIGLGLGPQHLDRIIGVVKAYQTRVGAGPFPTELEDSMGDHLVDHGHEYGTTTGRRRRTGWLDLVTVRYAARINGVQELALAKLDVLSGLNVLKTCVAYQVRGKRTEDFLADGELLAECQPVYVEIDGWEEAITGIRSWEKLPPATRRYVEHIEKVTGLPVTMISVGPEREQTIHRR